MHLPTGGAASVLESSLFICFQIYGIFSIQYLGFSPLVFLYLMNIMGMMVYMCISAQERECLLESLEYKLVNLQGGLDTGCDISLVCISIMVS